MSEEKETQSAPKFKIRKIIFENFPPFLFGLILLYWGFYHEGCNARGESVKAQNEYHKFIKLGDSILYAEIPPLVTKAKINYDQAGRIAENNKLNAKDLIYKKRICEKISKCEGYLKSANGFLKNSPTDLGNAKRDFYLLKDEIEICKRTFVDNDNESKIWSYFNEIALNGLQECGRKDSLQKMKIIPTGKTAINEKEDISNNKLDDKISPDSPVVKLKTFSNLFFNGERLESNHPFYQEFKNVIPECSAEKNEWKINYIIERKGKKQDSIRLNSGFFTISLNENQVESISLQKQKRFFTEVEFKDKVSAEIIDNLKNMKPQINQLINNNCL